MIDLPASHETVFHFRSKDGVDVTVYVRDNAFGDGVISRIPYLKGNFEPKGPFDRTCEHSRERGQSLHDCFLEAVYKHMYGLGMEGRIFTSAGWRVDQSLRSGESRVYVIGRNEIEALKKDLSADKIPLEEVPTSFLTECLQRPQREKPTVFLMNAFDETGSGWFLPNHLGHRVCLAMAAEMWGSTLILVLPQGVDFGEFFQYTNFDWVGLAGFL